MVYMLVNIRFSRLHCPTNYPFSIWRRFHKRSLTPYPDSGMKQSLPVFFVLLALCTLPFGSRAQTFTYPGASWVNITDNNTPVCLEVNVSGLPSRIDTAFGLAAVCLTASHSYDSDLSFVLMSPSGDIIPLITNQGGSTDNFTGTCLAEDAAAPIASGQGPFSGVYRPSGNIAGFNHGMNPNGIWQLCVTDRAVGDTGSVHTFSITFSAHPPLAPPPPPGPCTFTSMRDCQCPDGSDTCDLLPDMTSAKVILDQQRTESVGRLIASNGTPNIGYGPMEINGTGQCYCDTVRMPNCTDPCPAGMLKEKVEQTIYRKEGASYSSRRREAGFMRYHPSHGHIHVDGWAMFTLRTRTADPNPLNWPSLGSGTKISYCLINVGTCDHTNGYCVDGNGRVLDADSMPNVGLGRQGGCSTSQGVWPGRLDIYGQGSDGQEIDLTGICNGTYYLVSQTDPFNYFEEMDETNNVAVSQVTLTQQPAPLPTPFTLRQTAPGQIAAAAIVPNNARFSWDFGDGEMDSANSIVVHNYVLPNTYTVTLTVHHPCGDQMTSHTMTVTANKTHLTPAELALTAQPNPAKDGRFTITCRKPTAGTATVSILDLAGRTLRTLPIEGGIGRTSLAIEAPELKAGMYLVHLTTEAGQATVRLMIE